MVANASVTTGTGRDIRAAIEHHIEENPRYPGPEYARVTNKGVSVATIITALLFYGGDYLEVARGWDLDADVVKAAVWYYDLNKAAIDARLMRDRADYPARLNQSNHRDRTCG